MTTETFAWEQFIAPDGIHYRWGRQPIPDYITQYDNPQGDQPMQPRPFVHARNFVPTGVYTATYGRDTWDYMLTSLAELHGNCYYVNGGSDTASREGLVDFSRLAARLGVRVYYQNGSSEITWPNRVYNGGDRQVYYDRTAAWANDILPQFVSDPELKEGLVVWAPCEEIDVGTAQEPLLAQLRNDVFEVLDPYHPLTILVMSGSYAEQQALYDTWGDDIPLIVVDPYINHATVNRYTEANYLIARLANWQQMAMDHNSKLWLVLPSFSMNNDEPLAGTGGYNTVRPEDMNLSCWTSLAYGTTGFFLYIEYTGKLNGRAARTFFDWKVTEEFYAASRFFRTVGRLAPIIGYWTPVQPTQWSDDLAVGVMKHPQFDGQFLVVANTDHYNQTVYTPSGGSTVYELDTFQQITDSITLQPGMGVVLFSGGVLEMETLKDTLGHGPGIRLTQTIAAQQAQVWATGSDEEETVASRTDTGGQQIALGGKGGKPWVYTSEFTYPTPLWAGDPIAWDECTKVPAGYYYPPRCGPAENMLYLRFDCSNLASDDATIASAVLHLDLPQGMPGGRLAVYPIVGDGDDLIDDLLELMPRWELDYFSRQAGESIRIEVGGMVQEWIDGDMANRGLLVVYAGWPATSNPVPVQCSGELEVTYWRDPQNCNETWQAGGGLRADINRDCVVDLQDFVALIGQWQEPNEYLLSP